MNEHTDQWFERKWRELLDSQRYADAAAELVAARRPVERMAALFLGAAQRDHLTALRSSPAAIAEDPEVTDPEAEYAAWVERMARWERQATASAAASVAAGARAAAKPRPDRWPIDPDNAAVAEAAVIRARAAIAAMTGPDPVAAQAAREDVLHRWPADDQVAAAALAARFPGPTQEP